MAAKKKAASKVAESEKVEFPVVEEVQKAITKLDPNGKRHVPSGTPGYIQEALEILYGIVDVVEPEA